ncbi:MAG: hypothetical protein V7696_19880 [Halioglobus sp.]
MIHVSGSSNSNFHATDAHYINADTTGRAIDPETGQYFDDTKRYVDTLNLSDVGHYKVNEGNLRRVYSTLNAAL